MSKGGGNKRQRKMEYFCKLSDLLVGYKKALLFTANNVGSNQLQRVRQELNGKAVILMGKNTMIRRCIRQNLAKNPDLEALLPHVKGNTGFVFTNGDLADIKTRLSSIKVRSSAKAGVISPCDVVVPAGPIGQDPAKTSFFAALSIPTRICRGAVEIINDVYIVREGAKVTHSQAALLQMLNIQPFEYKLTVKTVYDEGSIYPEHLLDITHDDIVNRFRRGVADMAAISLRIGYPTVASVPNALAGSFRDLLSLSLATSYAFPQAEQLKDLLANPQAAPACGDPPVSTSSTSTSTSDAACAGWASDEEEEFLLPATLWG